MFVIQEASPVASTKKEAAAAAAVVPATAAAMEDGDDEAAAQEDGDEARSEATFSFKAQQHQIWVAVTNEVLFPDPGVQNDP
jgi:hypothetical protein